MSYARFALAFAGVSTLASCSPSKVAKSEDALGGNSPSLVSGEAPARDAGGPFGFRIGQQIGDVRGASPLDKPNLYAVDTPPKPHPDFERVILVAYPGTGICVIRGIGRDIAGDGAGSQVQSKVDSLSEALATKYGTPHKFNFCNGGEIKCDSQFWMMTLNDGERAYGFEWQNQNHTMKEASIGRILVGAQASDIQTTYPILEFHSAAKEACKKAERASSAASL